MAAAPPPVAIAHLREAVRVTRARTTFVPRLAIALDARLALSAQLEREATLPLPSGGDLLLGRLEGAAVAAWTVPSGWTSPERAVPVRLARLLGAELLLLAVPARALAPDPAAGLGVVEDHVGILTPNPLVGPNLDELGPRFPDMTEPYDPALRTLAREEAARVGWTLASGVYAAHPDPNLMTETEYTILRDAGVDWVGKEGVAEVITARHGGMRVLSLIGLEGAELDLAALARRVVARLA